MQHVNSFDSRSVIGGNGVRLYAEHVGDLRRPAIVLVHGFNQNCLVWDGLFASALAKEFCMLRFDLRGHGRSERPEDLAQYRESRAWADDVHAILQAFALTRPVLLGWSYGGYVLCDYLRHYGQEALGGLAFVGAATEMNTDEARALLGAEFLALGRGFLSNDAVESVTALTRLVQLLTHEPLSQRELHFLLGINAANPPFVRRGLLTRTISNADLLADLHIPVLIAQGADDRVVLPACAEFIARHVPHATSHSYPNCGHLLFAETPTPFQRDLAAFARGCAGPRT